MKNRGYIIARIGGRYNNTWFLFCPLTTQGRWLSSSGPRARGVVAVLYFRYALVSVVTRSGNIPNKRKIRAVRLPFSHR
jgi:hypothetical protein